MLLVIHGSPKIISSIYLLPTADLDFPVLFLITTPPLNFVCSTMCPEHIGPNVGRVTLCIESGRSYSILLYFDGFLSLFCGDLDALPPFPCPRTVEVRPVTIQQAEYDNSHGLFDVSLLCYHYAHTVSPSVTPHSIINTNNRVCFGLGQSLD